MKKLLLSLLVIGLMAGSAIAAGPTIEEGNRLQFTAADQETEAVFNVCTIVWASFTGSVIVDTNVMNLEDGDGNEVLKIAADGLTVTPVVVEIPGCIQVSGLKAEDLTKGYVTIYGNRK